MKQLVIGVGDNPIYFDPQGRIPGYGAIPADYMTHEDVDNKFKEFTEDSIKLPMVTIDSCSQVYYMQSKTDWNVPFDVEGKYKTKLEKFIERPSAPGPSVAKRKAARAKRKKSR